MIHNDLIERLSYVEILRQLQKSEQRGPPLTQLAFHTVNYLNIPSHKNRVGQGQENEAAMQLTHTGQRNIHRMCQKPGVYQRVLQNSRA